MSFPIPQNEAERLKALRDLKIFDGDCVPELNSLCEIARDHFRVPVALVSFIDSDDQVLKRRCGIGASVSPRYIAFFNHAIVSDDVFVVEDALKDCRFGANPLVIGEPHIRFYASVSLSLQPGLRLGSLCLVDYRARRLSSDQRTTLRRFAALAVDALRHRKTALVAKAQQIELVRQQSALSQTEGIEPIGHWEWEFESGCVRWSDGMYRLLGLNREDAEPSLERFLEAVHPQDISTVKAFCTATREQKRQFDTKYRIRGPNGEIRTLLSRGEFLKEDQDRPARAAGIAHDVTEQDAGAAVLRANEARWRLALQAGRMIAFDVDLETGLTRLSDHGHEATGIQSGHFTDFVNLVHPEDRSVVEDALELAMRDGTPYQIEFRFFRPDGEMRWFSQAGRLTTAEPEAPQRLAGVCFDISERKELETSLSEKKAQFRDFAEVSSDWLWEMDEEFRFARFIGDPENVLGIPTSAVIGRTQWEIGGADVSSPRWAQHIEDHKAHRPYRNFEYELPHESGGVRHALVSGRPFFYGNGRLAGYRGTMSDNTDSKVMEEQLRQALKMEAVGQLTGGIAHDFNNLLTIILGNSELLVEAAQNRPELRGLALTVQSAAERGANLTQHLLAFSRRQTLQPEPVDLAEAIAHVSGLLRRTLGGHITLRIRADSDVRRAYVDRTQLETALVNLALNGRDAMPNGGLLTIRASDARASDERSLAKPNKGFVRISVIDSGIGMSQEVLSRAFEPFFTTKPVGKGSGLGLSMVYGFAQQSGGRVDVDSVLGKGTSISLLLPCADSVALAPEKPSSTTLNGQGRILVVEDEPDVRSFVATQLASLGYESITAGDGNEALDRLQADPAISLLFTDLVMPNGISGVALAKRAAALRPDLPVLYTSGYADDVLAAHGGVGLGVPVLCKPYRRSELALAIQAALSRSPDAQCQNGA
jgi:PAS domain S-box-containing protein